MRRRSTRPANSGLTLIELVLALAILSILLALSVSMTGLIDNRRLAGAARVLATDIRYVQQRARAERRCWRIAFDPAAERYQIQVLQGETAGPGSGCAPGPRSRWLDSRTVALPPQIDLVSTTFLSNWLVLPPFGNPGAGSAILQTAGGLRRTVAVGPQGSVTVGPSGR